MERRKIGSLEVSAVGLGCMGITHASGAPMTTEEGVKVLRQAFEYGYTLFDTAECYTGINADGSTAYNEEVVGEALRPFRDKVVIATKCGVHHGKDSLIVDSRPETIRKSVEGSLKRLGTDYIDLYYQHRIDPKTAPEEVAETMAELIKAGKIRAWGVSFAPEEYIRRAHAVCKISAIENMYSFVARQDEGTYFPLCEELGITYVSACPLAKGYLSNRYTAGTTYREGDWRARMNLFRKEGMDANLGLMDLITEFAERKQATPAQIALAWEITKKPYLVPVPGTTKKDRVKENFDAVNVELSPAEMQEIEEALSHMDIVGMG